jgi:hypothetical protein
MIDDHQHTIEVDTKHKQDSRDHLDPVLGIEHGMLPWSHRTALLSVPMRFPAIVVRASRQERPRFVETSVVGELRVLEPEVPLACAVGRWDGSAGRSYVEHRSVTIDAYRCARCDTRRLVGSLVARPRPCSCSPRVQLRPIGHCPSAGKTTLTLRQISWSTYRPPPPAKNGSQDIRT